MRVLISASSMLLLIHLLPRVKPFPSSSSSFNSRPLLRRLSTSHLASSSTSTYSLEAPSTNSSSASLNGVKQRLSASALAKLSEESPLTMSFSQLSEFLGGTGRARIFWGLLRAGIDPLQYEGETNQSLSNKIKDKIRNIVNNTSFSSSSSSSSSLFSSSVVEETLSSCGTRKFLSELQDGLTIESVLIPSYKFDRTTLCVSTQVGCDRRCAFCATGKMGLIRNLTAVYYCIYTVYTTNLYRYLNSPSLV